MNIRPIKTDDDHELLMIDSIVKDSQPVWEKKIALDFARELATKYKFDNPLFEPGEVRVDNGPKVEIRPAVREPQIPPGYKLSDQAINYLAAMANAHNRRERRMLQARFRRAGYPTFVPIAEKV